METFTFSGKDFLLNGKKFNIYSGAIHYFRILPESWEDRLKKLKACGFNTVETYVPWNLHEPKPNAFVFDGIADIEKFLDTAKKVGLYAIVRPTPYICAEWEFGGFPAWLLQDKNIRLRCKNKIYLEKVFHYFDELLPRLKKHLITNGGNVIMLQIENEYGSYGNDKEYLRELRDYYLKFGIDVPFFTSDAPWIVSLDAGTVDGALPTVNFGSKVQKHFDTFQKIYGEKYPFMCSELWGGWFDGWGGERHTRASDEVVKEISDILKLDGNFNLYMFAGGTNFGFTAGANCDMGADGKDKFMPTTTSYDFCSPVDEYGNCSELYYKLQALLCEKQGTKQKSAPQPIKIQEIKEVDFTARATLQSNKNRIGETHKGVLIDGMESYGQMQGLIEYEFSFQCEKELELPVDLEICGIGDVAKVFVNGEFVKRHDRLETSERTVKIPLKGIDKANVSVLVDSYGRVNYGRNLGDSKGISAVYYNAQIFTADVTCYPLDNLNLLEYDNGESYPQFIKGTFKAEQGKPAKLSLKEFTRGMVWINGFNIGRYNNVGPQFELHVPGSLLKDNNEIIVMELESVDKQAINIGR